jgi:sugar lactone lactonase YvrE
MKSVHPWMFGAGLLISACGEDGGGSGQLAEAREVGVAVDSPFDATPSPKADAVYFTGMSVADAGVLYKIGTAAKSTPTMLASGFIAPTSVVVATAGDTVYVSDLGIVDEGDANTPSGPGGVIYRVPAGGGDKVPLAGTEGYGARSLDLVSEGKQGDVIYFSGSHPETGAAGVYRLPLGSGGALEAIYEGGTLRELSGIAVTADGDIYVIDTIGSSGGGTLIKISPTGDVSEVVVGLRVGYPAGLALTRDENFVLISGVNPEKGSSQVYRIELADPTFENIEVIDMGISQNTESAGLHRAHEVDNYAWADSGGTVYLLGTKAKALP